MGRTKVRGKSWNEMSSKRKAASGFGGIVQIALLVAALTDVRKRGPEELNGPKAAWIAASFVNFVGPIAYFVFGRKR